MEADDSLWESSRTRDKAVSFFNSEKMDSFGDDSIITLSEIKEEYLSNSSKGFFGTSTSNTGAKIVNKAILKQNTFIRDETGEMLKSDAPNRQCTEMDALSTIKKIIAHQEVSFKKFSDIASKLLLLDMSLKTYEENCIIRVIIFVKDTLNPSEFSQKLIGRPFAVRMYISYLKHMQHTDKLLDFYRLINKPEEAAMLKLKGTLLQKTTQQEKIDNLKSCLSSHFQPNFMLYFGTLLLLDYVKLLQLQIQIQKDDSENSKKLKMSILNRIPLKTPLFGRSLIGTLQYCCLYHYSRPENEISSPHNLKKEFHILPKHFQWHCLKSRCSLSYWHEIEKIFLTKNFFGMTQMKSIIGFEKVVKLLYGHKAPKEILIKYCDLIEDLDRRIELAKMCQCYECLLMTYKQTRNKKAFDQLKMSLKPDDSAYKLSLEINNDPTIKWKT